MSDIKLRSKRIITPEGIISGLVVIREGVIESVTESSIEDATGIIDLGDLVLMPGIIDPHVHINEPGRTEWEGFKTATKAAITGGITTLIEMPLNASPV